MEMLVYVCYVKSLASLMENSIGREERDLPTAVQRFLSTQVEVKFVKENRWIDNYNFNSVLCVNISSNIWNICLNVQVGIFCWAAVSVQAWTLSLGKLWPGLSC